MKREVYAASQASVLFKFWPDQAEWFVVGGPADANEAQTVHKKYPDVKCIGFEPNPFYRSRQIELAFPGSVRPYALWDQDGAELTLAMTHINQRSGSVCRDYGEEASIKYRCTGRTLDSLSQECGPFSNVVLWLDVEFAETQALRGAENLLKTGQILLANVEVWDENYDEVCSLLNPHGLVAVKDWAHTIRDKRDVVFQYQESV